MAGARIEIVTRPKHKDEPTVYKCPSSVDWCQLIGTTTSVRGKVRKHKNNLMGELVSQIVKRDDSGGSRTYIHTEVSESTLPVKSTLTSLCINYNKVQKNTPALNLNGLQPLETVSFQKEKCVICGIVENQIIVKNRRNYRATDHPKIALRIYSVSICINSQ